MMNEYFGGMDIEAQLKSKRKFQFVLNYAMNVKTIQNKAAIEELE